MVEKNMSRFWGKKRLGTFCRLFDVQLLFFVVLLGAPQGQASYYTLLIMEDMN